MSDPRTTHRLGEHPKARFRCMVCRKFVTATERGVCPTCGFKPPTLIRSGRRDPRVWLRAAHRARQQNAESFVARYLVPSWRWLLPVLIALGWLALTAR